LMLRMPVFGELVRKSTIARWTRTLATMFAAGVPLVEALDSVGGASGNYIYLMATKQIQAEVSTGTSLTVAMQNANVFPSMVLQMCSIGEETGALDGMLSKVADFYEAEVDDAVEALSSLMEPECRAECAELAGQEPVKQETYNLVVPRSRCPGCGHAITARENIPLASYLALRGRCSACGARIDIKYPVVELLAGLAAAYS